jgi:hypothetical protein
MAQHIWVTSNPGHGEVLCQKCKITNREAAALGLSNYCALPDAVHPPVQEKEKYRKFEYKVWFIREDNLNDELNRQGQIGWELVQLRLEKTRPVFECIMKREIR